MVSFFFKKRYLVDLLEGFIDIHNHILPGIDDGAKTVEDSIELLKGFAEFGVHDFICTPHIMSEYYPNTPRTIDASYKILKNELNAVGINHLNIDYAAEHMIDSNFETILELGEVVKMGRYHLLVEMSFLQPSINFDTAIRKIGSKNIYAVLAHPERYGYLHKTPRSYASYKNTGIQFQVNLLSLCNYYGSEIRNMAMKLIEQKFVNYVGSDIHNSNQLSIMKKTTVSRKLSKQLKPIIENTIETFI